MAGRKNSDNTQAALVSLTGVRAAPGADGDGLEPLVDQHGRFWVRDASGVLIPPSTATLFRLGPAAAGVTGFGGRVMRITGIVDSACFAQFFDSLNVIDGDTPIVQTQLLAAGNFEIDLTAMGGLEITSGGLGFAWSTTRNTLTTGGFSGLAYVQGLQAIP